MAGVSIMAEWPIESLPSESFKLGIELNLLYHLWKKCKPPADESAVQTGHMIASLWILWNGPLAIWSILIKCVFPLKMECLANQIVTCALLTNFQTTFVPTPSSESSDDDLIIDGHDDSKSKNSKTNFVKYNFHFAKWLTTYGNN